jgi:hypothetical protein
MAAASCRCRSCIECLCFYFSLQLRARFPGATNRLHVCTNIGRMRLTTSSPSGPNRNSILNKHPNPSLSPSPFLFHSRRSAPFYPLFLTRYSLTSTLSLELWQHLFLTSSTRLSALFILYSIQVFTNITACLLMRMQTGY